VDKGKKYSSNITCYGCSKTGHIQKEYRSFKAKDASSSSLALKN
jgi:hypothetical protein